jgi:hypothetical protein
LPKPDFALTARAIAEEFGKDAGSAKKKYASKIIRLEGRVQKVGTDDSGVPYIELEGDGERTIGIGFATSQEAYVREIKKGQDVVLQGSYFIFLSNEISLNDGGIVVDPD